MVMTVMVVVAVMIVDVSSISMWETSPLRELRALSAFAVGTHASSANAWFETAKDVGEV